MTNATEYQLQHWDDNRGSEIIAVNAVSLTVLLLVITLRIYAQTYVTNPWKHMDTWFAMAATVFAVAVAGCVLKTTQYGLGKHTLRIILEDPKAPDNLAGIFMYGYILSILQAVCITCTKLAMLSLYARVFGMVHQDNYFAYSVYACATFCILLGIGLTLTFILQCIPPPVFWNRIYLLFPVGHTKGPTEGYCMDQTRHVVVPPVLDLISELAIMLLPSKMLWKLHLPLKKKIGLMATFGLGIFVMATNIVRINYYARMINGGDLAWDDIDALLWTVVQMCVAIVCASIPPCAPLLKVWSSKNPKNRSTKGYSRSVPLVTRSTNISGGSSAGGTMNYTNSSRISRKDEWTVDSNSV